MLMRMGIGKLENYYRDAMGLWHTIMLSSRAALVKGMGIKWRTHAI